METMMSFRKVHAGAGYQYLLRSVATNDAYDKSVEEGKLSAYYQAKGTPPGRWMGSGLAALDSATVTKGALVEADQMSALYGTGLHPDTHALIEGGATLDDCRLGRRFPIYTGGKKFAHQKLLQALKKAEAGAEAESGRPLTDSERTGIALAIGRPYLANVTGNVDATDKQVVAWVNHQVDQVKQAVSSFDLTFSPTKSISVVWALADESTANVIAQCHHEAVEDTLAWLESHVLRTRRGAGGIEQISTQGIIASAFTHFDTRAGDPDLHTHVLVSNKVLGVDGKWSAIDGKPLFAHHQTLSARYDAIIQQRLSERLGVAFIPHQREGKLEPVWEVDGVPQELIDSFSKRRVMARPVYDELLNAYVKNHGKQPDSRTQKSLWQQAILDTRDEKKLAHSLAELRLGWGSDVAAMFPDLDVETMLATVLKSEDQRPWITNTMIGTGL